MLWPLLDNHYPVFQVKPSARGFTLIELMIVITVLSVMASLLSPTIGTMVRNHHADNLLSELELDIQFARNLSISNTNETELTPLDNDWNNGWVIRDRFTNEVLRQRGSITNPIAEWGGVSSTSYSSGNPLIFDAQGRAKTAGSFKVNVPGCQGKRLATLEIKFLGQIMVKRTQC